MPDVWGDGDAAPLLEACRARRFDHALNLLRYGAFLERSACAPAVLPAGASWFEVRQMPPAVVGEASPLLGLLQTMVSETRPLHLRAESGPGRPRLLLGVDGGSSRAAHVRSLLAPAIILEPGAPPVPWRSGPVAGVVYRLIPTGLERAAEQPSQTMLSRLLTLPVPSWAVSWSLWPVETSALDQLLAGIEDCEAALAPHLEESRQRTGAASVKVTDAHARRLGTWLDLLHNHASTGRGCGMWVVSCHATAPEDDMQMLVSALRGALADRTEGQSSWVASSYAAGDRAAAPPRSLLSARDLDRLFATPRTTVPGLAVAPALPAGRVAAATRRPLRLGCRLGTDEPFVLDLDDLEGHAFVTGTTGSGKSTTVRRLLADLWNRHRVPFLVLDPVKADYQSVAGELDGPLTIVNARDLRLNVLQAWEGTDPAVHLEQVANVFKGSFSMPSPVPYVVTQLFDLLVQRVGHEPEPTLHDLRDRVDGFVRSLGYAAEADANIRAAVGNRLGLLLSPVRADRVASVGGELLEHLVKRPAVIQLGGLGDDEERAFLMSMLAVYMGEAARARGAVLGVAHITVLEEAHRILPEPSAVGSDPERGDAGGTSARLLTQLLAEIRSYGEALVIVDQSPGAVARDVLRNTNLKVAHRLLAPEDREEVGASIGVPEDGSWGLTRLEAGHALVSTRRVPEPQAVQVEAPSRASADGTVVAPPRPRRGRPCCPDPDATAVHHVSERHAIEAGRIMALYAAGSLVGTGDGATLTTWTTGQLRQLARRRPGTQIACLAWVGLRRVLERDIELGLLGPRELAPQLSALFQRWKTGQPATREATPRRARRAFDVPYAGCAACACKCSLPGSAVSRLADEPAPGLRSAIDSRLGDPIAACRQWMAEQERLLAPMLGEDPARSLALCMLLHGLAAAGIDDNRALEVLRT